MPALCFKRSTPDVLAAFSELDDVPLSRMRVADEEKTSKPLVTPNIVLTLPHF